MLKRITFIATLLAAPFAQAGDYLEGYFYVVGSVPATIPVIEMTDVAKPIFRQTLATLTAQWSTKCNTPVDVWHTNLMHSETTPWTPDYWFVYIAMADSAAQAKSIAPASECASQGYVKQGGITFPTLYQICAQPDVYPEIYQQSCQ